MSEETRNQKLLRELNEQYIRDRNTVKGMSDQERHTLAVIIMVVAVLALVAGLVWAGVANAASFPITISCPRDQANDTCTLTRHDADKVFALIQHNNAATAALAEQAARKCPTALNES